MNKSQQGFTLIEVMVAIMLMALVSVIAWRGLDSVTRADQHLQASTEQTEGLLRALKQMQRDISLRASVELAEPGTAKDAGLAAVTVRSSDSKGFRLEVIRSAPATGDGLQRVRWWLKGDSLYRAAAPAWSDIGRWWGRCSKAPQLNNTTPPGSSVHLAPYASRISNATPASCCKLKRACTRRWPSSLLSNTSIPGR